jgi:hypothetical protein
MQYIALCRITKIAATSPCLRSDGQHQCYYCGAHVGYRYWKGWGPIETFPNVKFTAFLRKLIYCTLVFQRLGRQMKNLAMKIELFHFGN